MASARRIPVPAGRVPPGTDYAVAFRLDMTPSERVRSNPSLGDASARVVATAEQWARGVFENPPAVVRLGLQFGWRVPLRLRLGPSRSPDTVAGWPIVGSTPTRCDLRADSTLIVAANWAEVDDTGVMWVTEVNYKSRLGRILWSLAAPIHQATLPIFLRMAARSLSGDS